MRRFARPPSVVRIQDPRDPTGRRVRGGGTATTPPIPHAPTPIPFWMTLFTAMFLHGSPMHLIGNMLYLWIVGDNVEEVLGSVRYIIVYLACGLMGALAQIIASPDSMIPTLGASGAIAGIMGAYVIWFPHNQIRVLVFRFITVLPAVVVIGGWIILQIWLGAGSFGKIGESGGVAYLAHVGGALTGICVALLFYDRASTSRNGNSRSRGGPRIPMRTTPEKRHFPHIRRFPVARTTPRFDPRPRADGIVNHRRSRVVELFALKPASACWPRRLESLESCVESLGHSI